MNNYEQDLELYFELKGTPDSSQESYKRRILAYVQYIEKLGKSAEEASERDIQQYILHLKRERKLSPGTINNYIAGIKFFHTHVLGKEWDKKRIPLMKRPKYFPVVPPKEEILEILKATSNVKHKAILVLIYGSGLRVSEAAKLKIGDICSKTMRVRVEGTKHDTNRYTILSNTALEILRAYFKEYFMYRGIKYSPEDWLFQGQKNREHIHIKTIKNTIIKIKEQLEVNQKISAHTLRRCFATHLLEDGVDPVYIQQMLGHKRLQTTVAYLHMTSKSLMGIKSPLDTGTDI